MTIGLSSKGIVSGSFSTNFTVAMGVGSVDGFLRSAVMLAKLDESGFLDPTTLMPSSGGTVGLVAGSAAIGSIIGRSSNPLATPTVTAGAYTTGQEVGGLMTFAVGGAGSGVLETVSIACKSVQTATSKLYIFDTNPTNSTWTDHSTPAINVADVAKLLAGPITLSSPDSGLGTHTIWGADSIARSFVGANLYGILVVVGTPTFASTSDITVQLGIIDD